MRSRNQNCNYIKDKWTFQFNFNIKIVRVDKNKINLYYACKIHIKYKNIYYACKIRIKYKNIYSLIVKGRN